LLVFFHGMAQLYALMNLIGVAATFFGDRHKTGLNQRGNNALRRALVMPTCSAISRMHKLASRCQQIKTWAWLDQKAQPLGACPG
jgi:hypothetical protein